MTQHVPQLEPDAADVMQEEPPEPLQMQTVPVDIQGPVRTQALPRKSAAARTVPIGVNPVRLLPADPHRALARLIALGTGNIVIGFSASAFSADGAATVTWPSGIPFDVFAVQAIWVAQAAGSSVTQVSYYREGWAQG